MRRDIRNALLSRLSPYAYERVIPLLTHKWLSADTVLVPAGHAARYAYFPESAIISVTTCAENERRCCAGIYGFEGFGNLSIVHGAPVSSHTEIVQMSGYSYRIGSSDLRDMSTAFPDLQRSLMRYAHIFLTQVSYTALSNSTVRIEQRLARWLLMFHDRSMGPSLAITHQRLSDLLSVRRSGVTEAIHVLEGRKLITAKRGLISILDRPGLEDLTAGSYGPPESQYRQFM